MCFIFNFTDYHLGFNLPFVLSIMISLHVQQLSKNFGQNRVLQNISFHHDKGVLGIAGPNGSGKSTLLKCISGLLRPGSGSITWKSDQQVIGANAIKQKLGYAAPYISLYRELSVIENLRFLSKLRKAKPDHSSAKQLLARLELDHIAEKPYGTLSTGQQQRARLAAALFIGPDILLLDEPGSNLDEQGRILIKNIVARAKEEQKLVILASNSQEELALCDRIFSVKKEEVINF